MRQKFLTRNNTAAEAREYGLQTLREFRILATDKTSVDQITPSDPLFFIRFVRLNTEYLSLLENILKNKFQHVMDFVEFLERNTQWDINVISSRLATDGNALHQNNYGFDLVYVAYLSQLVQYDFFYDYVHFYCALNSFTGKDITFHQKDKQYSVSKLPVANIVMMRHLDWGNYFFKQYIQYLIDYYNQANHLHFSKDQFIGSINSKKGFCILTMTINLKEYTEILNTPSHGMWFTLFHNMEYGQIEHIKQNDSKTMMIAIPGYHILSAFRLAVVTSSSNIVQPALALGSVSSVTSKGLHKQGFHIASPLDARFNCNPTVHHRLSAPIEALLHDTIFHTTAISAVPSHVRNFFSETLYDKIEQYQVFISQHYPEKNTPLFKHVIGEFKQRCIDLDLENRAQDNAEKNILLAASIRLKNIFSKIISDVYLIQNKNSNTNIFLSNTSNQEMLNQFCQSDQYKEIFTILTDFFKSLNQDVGEIKFQEFQEIGLRAAQGAFADYAQSFVNKEGNNMKNTRNNTNQEKDPVLSHLRDILNKLNNINSRSYYTTMLNEIQRAELDKAIRLTFKAIDTRKENQNGNNSLNIIVRNIGEPLSCILTHQAFKGCVEWFNDDLKTILNVIIPALLKTHLQPTQPPSYYQFFQSQQPSSYHRYRSASCQLLQQSLLLQQQPLPWFGPGPGGPYLGPAPCDEISRPGGPTRFN